jgi:SGNH hydrolase-like domain, acetyltransferase AlgX
MLPRFFRLALFVVHNIVFGWILFFLVIEIFPDLLTIVQLQGIQYYAMKNKYASDPQLVFRRTSKTDRRSSYPGDLFKPEYGVQVEPIDYTATYDRHGFRKNSSEPPYDIAVIGDSYIEMGESDATTFTEFLRRETDLSVLNLGHWEETVPDAQLATLKSILSEFKSLSHGNRIVPILIYIPTATQVYAELYSPDSNHKFINKVTNATGDPSLAALTMIAGHLNLNLVNLLPVFKNQASKGRLLYYPFDTHWNREGRQIAASFIASYLKNGVEPALDNF